MIVRTRCFRRVWSSWWSHCAQLPGALTNSIAHFNFVPFLPIISPLIVLPIALVPWIPIRWVPPAWARGRSKRRGWWLICWGLLFVCEVFTPTRTQATKGTLFVRMKLIIQSLPGTCWDEFDSHIFSPLLLHIFEKHFLSSWYPSLDAEGGPLKSSPNARRKRRFWDRPLCSAVAMWEMSIFAKCSKYRTKASVHPWVIWVSFFVNRLPFCPTLTHTLVCSFSNNLSEHLLLWYGVPYGVGWMVAFIKFIILEKWHLKRWIVKLIHRRKTINKTS